jgi:hypothetical protein
MTGPLQRGPAYQDERIRTSDLLDPNQARYQAALHPVAEEH